ncbi:beta-arrestin-1 isoform X2 [Labeo rohita]|uniref:Beta-arrestin-1 isoform X2 n=1 Tax=Labeo rohita TaxID=84645 RepID=A0A498L5A9_LABRO|nr:beta-arrestin-1 isoform X2 [Labeo rohita]
MASFTVRPIVASIAVRPIVASIAVRPIVASLTVRSIVASIAVWPIVASIAVRPVVASLAVQPKVASIAVRPIVASIAVWPIMTSIAVRPITASLLLSGLSWLLSRYPAYRDLSLSDLSTGTGRSRDGGYPTTVVLDESWIQDEPPGNPRPLLRTVTFPVNKVLGATATGSRIKDSPDGVRRTTVNDPGRRWGSWSLKVTGFNR